MRDGINLARLGVPALALVTEKFWPQGEFVAQSLGMPDVPKVRLPHPVAGSGDAQLKSIAEALAAGLIERLAA